MVPTLILHDEDDQVVPYEDAAPPQAMLIGNSTLKIYPGFPHGRATVNAGEINADIQAFIKH